MNQIWTYTIIAVFIVSAISLVGIIALALSKNLLEKILHILVAFSVGALLGDAFIHLLPEAMENSGFSLFVSISILAGIGLFFILEKIICWRHCHIPVSEHHNHPIATMNLIGDGLHNFIDGMLIAGSFLVSIPLGIATTIAVILHEIPQEMGDFGVLVYAGYTRAKAILFNFISALTAVGGAIFILIIGKNSNITKFLIPFTAGGFIYIALSDLIPELHKKTKISQSIWQLVFIFLGILIMIALI